MFSEEKNIRNLKKEFTRLDRYYQDLNNKLFKELKAVVTKYYPNFIFNNKNTPYFEIFSTHLVSNTETVINKSFNYSDFRLSEELRNAKRISETEIKRAVNKNFEKDLLTQIKSFLIDNFPKIFDLNANGFRLLDVNTKIYTNYFLVDFYFDENFTNNDNQ